MNNTLICVVRHAGLAGRLAGHLILICVGRHAGLAGWPFDTDLCGEACWSGWLAI